MTGKTRLDMAERLDQIAPDQWAALAGILGRAANMDPLDVVKAILRGTTAVTVEIVRRLTDPHPFILPAVEKPKRLKDCDGVWLSPNAKELFASVEELSKAEERSLERRGLVDWLSELDLIEELGGEDVAMFCSVAALETAISQLVIKQAGGKPGDLMNGGEANIFYVRDPENPKRALYVIVNWSRDSRRWGVRCNAAGADPWLAGYRVFRAAAT